MRLLNTATRRPREFFGEDIPAYAVLSHRWSNEEPTYGDLLRHTRFDDKHLGWRKVRQCCHVAGCDHDLSWVWIDTCCIDKRSSTEVSEAVNSMFTWYRNAAICLVFLPDVNPLDEQPPERDFSCKFIPDEDASECETPPPPPPSPPPADVPFHESELRQSTWFTRGWTLQELLAPAKCRFYNNVYQPIGSKESLCPLIQDITGIPSDTLRDSRKVFSASIAQCLSWAARRQTTRPEDRAYSMLGVLDVSMPLLYGEGLARSFMRLQEKLVEVCSDDTLYVWDRSICDKAGQEWRGIHELEWRGILAPSIEAFRDCEGIRARPSVAVRTFTNIGLELHIAMPKNLSEKQRRQGLIILACEKAAYENTAGSKRRAVNLPLGIFIYEGYPAQHSSRAFHAQQMTDLVTGTAPWEEPSPTPGQLVRLPFPDLCDEHAHFVYSVRSGTVYVPPSRKESRDAETPSPRGVPVFQLADGETQTTRVYIYQSGRSRRDQV